MIGLALCAWALASGCSSPTRGSTDHYNRGVQLALTDRARAEREFQAALRDNPNNVEAHNQLGRLYFADNRYDEAIECFQNAVRLQPANPNYVENLGKAALMKRDYPLAVESFRRAMQLAPAMPAYPYYLGVIAEREGRKQEALHHYRKALEIDDAFTAARRRVRDLEQPGFLDP